MSSRRTILKQIAMAITSTGTVLDTAAAQHVHLAAAAEKAAGDYKVKAFQPHQYKAIRRLAELIVPADEKSGSALEAGAPEFIDLLCSQNDKLAKIYHSGLAWMDAEMRHRYSKSFVDASETEQTAMLDTLVDAERKFRARRAEELVYERSANYKDFSGYATTSPGDLGPGVIFFDWIRKMTVDAYYTSPIGVKDLDYKGNKAYSSYQVPKEALEYALKRSPFGNG